MTALANRLCPLSGLVETLSFLSSLGAMSGLRLLSVRHGPHRRSLVLYSAMPRAEAERLLSAAFGVQDGATLALMDPISRRKWTVHEACRDTATLPDVLDLLTHTADAVTAQDAGAATTGHRAAAHTPAAFNTETRPLLHHHQHSHRVQPYQPHNRQQSRTAHQFTQQMIADLQQQQQQQPSSPLPSAPSTVISFPPPFVLSLHSLTDLAQALQLSEHLIVLLFIVSPASASSTALSRLYQQLASSALYRNLLFVSVESSLLASAASAATSAASPPLLLPVTLPPPPALQLYYAGACIVEVGNVNEEQLITIVQSSDELMQHIAANGSSNDESDSAGHHDQTQQQQQQQRTQDSPSGRVRWEEGEEEEVVLLSADEAVALEKLVPREDQEVLQAYAAFPELSLVVDAFMRIAKHVGREKEARKRRVGQRTAASTVRPASTLDSSSQQPTVNSTELDELLSMTLSALQQHGLLSSAEVDGVLQLYGENDLQVLQTLLTYQRDGREEQLMENLLRIAMAHKLGMTAQLPYDTIHSGTTDADDGKVSGRGSDSRDWEGRDDSEALRARRMAALGSSATRSRWATQPQRLYRPNAEQEEEAEEEEDEDEEEEGEDEGQPNEEEDEVGDDGEDEGSPEVYEDDSEPLNVAMSRLGFIPTTSASFVSSTSASSSAISGGVSSRVYEEAVNLLAALSFQQLITPEQLSLFVALLTEQHPLFLSALLAYQQTSDIDDLLNTLNKVHKRLGGQQSHSAQPQQQPTTATSAVLTPRVVEMSGENAELAMLLSQLPPDFLTSHGAHLSSLIANRDAVLLSALQIWREQQGQDQYSGRDRERQHKDTQQLLTVVMRRAEKERQRAETSRKARQQLRSANAGAATAIPAPAFSASFAPSSAQPQSPLSPQVTADQLEQLRHAYSSGVQQQQQQRHQPPAGSTVTSANVALDSSRRIDAASASSQLERVMARLQSTGVLSDADRSFLRSRLAAGDARMLAVLQLSAADGDEDELTHSITRIAHNHRQQQPAASNDSSGSSDGPEDRALSDSNQSATTQPASTQASQAGGINDADSMEAGTDSSQQAAAVPAAVTVEDVTLEADNKNEDIATAPSHSEEPLTEVRGEEASDMNGAASQS